MLLVVNILNKEFNFVFNRKKETKLNYTNSLDEINLPKKNYIQLKEFCKYNYSYKFCSYVEY